MASRSQPQCQSSALARPLPPESRLAWLLSAHRNLRAFRDVHVSFV